MSTIKYNRVKKISPLGKFHGSFDAIWGAIPQSTVDGLTSNALVMLVSAIWASWERTKDIARKEIDTFDTYTREGIALDNNVALFKDGVFKIKTEYVCKNWGEFKVGAAS